MKTYREVERKVRVHALFRLPALTDSCWAVASVDSAEPFTLDAVYYDTDDLRLFRWRHTLRRREGGGDAGWHLKCPVEGAEGRDEVRLPLEAGAAGQVPAELADLVLALTRGKALAPIVTLRTSRTAHLLRNAEGSPVAELVDDVVSVLDADRTVAVFREIEVEAVAGDDGDLDLAAVDDVVSALVAAGGVPGEISKAASALGPRAAEPPDVPEAVWPRPDEPAWLAVRALLRTHTRRLIAADVGVRRDLPDSVHQMRVAARRLRSGLRAFAPLVDADWATRLRGELGWIAGELGHARDTEVIMARLLKGCDQLPAADGQRAAACLEPWFEARMENARTHALAALRTPRYLSLLEALVAACESAPTTQAAEGSCEDVLPALVHKRFRRLRKAVHPLDEQSLSAQWHEARIDAKKARYAADAVIPIFGARARRISMRFEEVTELLGAHQDAHVAQAALQERLAEGDLDAPTAFALGMLHAVEGQEERALRSRFRSLWPKVKHDYKKNRLDQ